MATRASNRRKASTTVTRQRCDVCRQDEVLHRGGFPDAAHVRSAGHQLGELAQELYDAHAAALQEQGVPVLLHWYTLTAPDRFPWMATAEAARRRVKRAVREARRGAR